MACPNKPLQIVLAVSWSAIFAGFVAQLYQITNQYLDYDVVTVLKIYRPEEVCSPQVIYCVPYDRLNITGDADYDYIEWRNTWRYQLNASFIIRKAPKLQDVDVRCAVFDDLHGLLTRGKDFCLENITIRMLVKHQFVCYAFQLAVNRKFNFRYLANNEDHPNFFHFLWNASQINHSMKQMTIFLRPYDDDFSGTSDTFVENEVLQVNGTKEMQDSIISLTYGAFHSKLLEHPYKTNCFDYRRKSKYEFFSQASCFEYCVANKTHAAFKQNYTDSLIPMSIAVHADGDFKDVPLLNMFGWPEASAIVKRVEHFCYSLCGRPDCRKLEYVPRKLGTQPAELRGFDINISNQPEIWTEVVEKFSFIDFITFALSTVSFWFGISPRNLSTDIISKFGPSSNNQATRLKHRTPAKVRKSLSHLTVEVEQLKHIILEMHCELHALRSKQ